MMLIKNSFEHESPVLIYCAGLLVMRQAGLSVFFVVLLDYFLIALNDHIDFIWLTSLIQILVWSFLAFQMHRNILRSRLGELSGYLNFIPFFFLSLFLLIVIAFPALFCARSLFFFIGGDFGFENDLLFFLLAQLIAAAFFALLLIPFFGTLLPAQVVGGNKGLGLAYRRGKSQFFWITDRLLAGPGAFTAAAITLSLVLFPLIDRGGPLISITGEFDGTQSISVVLASLFRAFSLAMTVVILSWAYLINPKGKSKL